MKRRPQPFIVAELRKTLMAPPYGLPPVSHALFAAVALRHDHKRIAWVGKARGKLFAENLANAFAADSKYETQLEDFSPEQKIILSLLGLAMPNDFRTSEPKQAATNLSAFFRTLPDSVKNSGKLTEPAKKLSNFMAHMGRTAHGIADFLYPETPLATEIQTAKFSQDCILTRGYFEALFASFAEAREAKYSELYADVKKLLDDEFATLDRPTVLENLAMDHSAMARPVSKLLEADNLDRSLLEGLARAALERTIDDCDDKALATLIERLRQTLLQNKVSKAGENRAAVRKALANALADVDGSILIANLEAEQNQKALALVALLQGDWQTDDAALDAFIKSCVGKTLPRCNRYEIGALLKDIEILIGRNSREKPKPEDLRRERLAFCLSSLRREYDWERVVEEWQRIEESGKPAALSIAMHNDGNEHLDALALAFTGLPVADCVTRDIEDIGYQLASQFKSLNTALQARKSMGRSVAEAFAKAPDAGVLRQNLQGDGQPVALALLVLLDAGEPFGPASLDALIQEGLKKPAGHCDEAEIAGLAKSINALLQKHHEDRDPRRQLAEDFRVVVAKHKALVGQDRLLEVLALIIKELQVGRL